MAEVQRDDAIGNREDSLHFVILIQMFAQQALMQMGKIMNPVTKKAERDLEAAEFTISLIESLQKKTSGNLTPDEDKLLKTVLTDLRLNFVEESNRPTPKEAASTEKAEPSDKATSPTTEDQPDDSKRKFHKKYD